MSLQQLRVQTENNKQYIIAFASHISAHSPQPPPQELDLANALLPLPPQPPKEADRALAAAIELLPPQPHCLTAWSPCTACAAAAACVACWLLALLVLSLLASLRPQP
jgi:hypothetical protein